MGIRTTHIEVIDALRGLAALSVAHFHFTSGGWLLSSGWLKTSGFYGWLGVDVFFVISGFIIPFALHQAGFDPRRHFPRFIRKRWLRLYPPYIVAIVLALLLAQAAAFAPGFRGSLPTLDPVALLLHLGYLNEIFGYPWVIRVLWTLAIEFQFYILVALLFPLVASSSAWLRSGTLTVLCAAAFLLPNDAFVFHYLPLFTLGILTFERSVGLVGERAYWLLLAPCFLATVFSLGLAAALAGLFTALAIAFVRLPRIAPLAFLGAISYSIYLLHLPIGMRVVNLGSRVAHTPASQVLVMLVAMGVTIAAAWLMYRLVELPARRWSAAVRYEDPPLRKAPVNEVERQ